jgi:hypothetical protein
MDELLNHDFSVKEDVMIFYVLLFGASVVGFIIGCMFCAFTTSSKMRELEEENAYLQEFVKISPVQFSPYK